MRAAGLRSCQTLGLGEGVQDVVDGGIADGVGCHSPTGQMALDNHPARRSDSAYCRYPVFSGSPT